MKLYSKPLITLCAIVLAGTWRAGAQTSTDALHAQYSTCVKLGGNKIDCAKRWYQQTDSLLETVYQQLWKRCDSAQRVNLEDEREEWMEQRNLYFKSSYADFKRKDPDDPFPMFMANIGFINKRIKNLQLSEPKHYAPSSFLVGITGSYELEAEPGSVEEVYVRRLLVREGNDGVTLMRLFFRSRDEEQNRVVLADSLPLQQNGALYVYDVPGGTCSIRFNFTRRGVNIRLLPAQEGVNCVFGKRVPIDGFYKRTSTKAPSYKALGEGI